MPNIKTLWEIGSDQFEHLPRQKFNALARSKAFAHGPLVAEPGAWVREFAPHDPNRWAFGRLADGRLVKAHVKP